MDAVATCRRSVFIGWAYVPVLTIVQLNELDNIMRFLVSAGFLYIFGHFAGEQLNDGDLDDDDEMGGSGRRSVVRKLYSCFKALVDRFDACPRKALGHPTVNQQSMSVGGFSERRRAPFPGVGSGAKSAIVIFGGPDSAVKKVVMARLGHEASDSNIRAGGGTTTRSPLFTMSPYPEGWCPMANGGYFALLRIRDEEFSSIAGDLPLLCFVGDTRKIKCTWQDSYLFHHTKDDFYSSREDFDNARGILRRRVVKVEPRSVVEVPSLPPTPSSSALPPPLPSTVAAPTGPIPAQLPPFTSSTTVIPIVPIPPTRPFAEIAPQPFLDPLPLLLTRFPTPISRTELADLTPEALIELVLSLSCRLDAVTMPRLAQTVSQTATSSLSAEDVPPLLLDIGIRTLCEISMAMQLFVLRLDSLPVDEAVSPRASAALASYRENVDASLASLLGSLEVCRHLFPRFFPNADI
ncbi:hypothetical protein C8R43DRAFT_1127032 [Mycena crocata]|nr:hypothetical protein C8R43DRAFT_1127032 [Mycena crocata]